MKTTFFIQSRTDKKAATVIFLRLSHAPDKVAFSTKIKIPFSAWDAKAKKVKPAYSHSSQINKDLREIEDKVSDILQDMRKEPDFNEAKKRIGNIFGVESEQGDVSSLFGAFEKFLAFHKKNSAYGTWANYNYLKNMLKAFNPELRFQDINVTFFERFADWMFDQETDKKKKKQTNNTVYKNLTNVRAFLNWCRKAKNEIKALIPLLPEDFLNGIKPNDVKVIYLREEELLKLYFMEFEGDEELIKDMFCLGCFTGLRYSDIKALSRGNITMLSNGEVKYKAINITTQKTSEPVVIPLVQYSEAILEKYNYHFPKEFRSDDRGPLIRKVCKEAGFDEIEKEVRFRRVKRIEVNAPKHELINFHDSRATFIILLLIKGIPQRVIMEMTGHVDFDSFKKYIKITPSVSQTALQRAWGSPTALTLDSGKKEAFSLSLPLG